MKIRDTSLDEIINELEYVLDTRHELLARLHRLIARHAYASTRALLLALARYWGRR